jgi:uncharacterized RDD family membrane protein YckC
MRCPKCHYVSFDGQQRCRNCGYDFSLSPPTEPLDVPTHPGDRTAAPLPDLPLRSEPSAARGGENAAEPRLHMATDEPAERGTNEPNVGRGFLGRGMAARAAQGGTAAASGAGPRERGASTLGTATGAGSREAGAAGFGAARSRAEDVDPLDLPLFDRGIGSTQTDRGSASASGLDRPLIATVTPPRPPLAVRRTSADSARARARVTPSPTPRVDEPTLDLDLPDRLPEPDLAIEDDPTVFGTGSAAGTGSAIDLGRSESAPAGGGLFGGLSRGETGRADMRGHDANRAADRHSANADTSDAADSTNADIAPLGSRAIAAALDLAFLAFVDLIVLHFTLRLTGLPATLDGLSRLPVAPLLGFLALLNGGYLTMFIAASGQTMGKMAMGVKVVPMEGEAVPFGHAVLRAILWLLTIVPLGIGALPALITDDRRALHDRLANTRVISTRVSPHGRDA